MLHKAELSLRALQQWLWLWLYNVSLLPSFSFLSVLVLLTIVRSSQFTRRLHTTVAVLALLVTTLLCKARAKHVFIDHKDEKNILHGGVRSVIQVRIPHTA